MSDIRELLKQVDKADGANDTYERNAMANIALDIIRSYFSDDQIARMLEAGPDRVVVLPVKPGETVYDFNGTPHRVDDILLFYPKQNGQVPPERMGVLQMRLATIDSDGYEEWANYADNIGDTIFLTPEAAAAALKGATDER